MRRPHLRSVPLFTLVAALSACPADTGGGRWQDGPEDERRQERAGLQAARRQEVGREEGGREESRREGTRCEDARCEAGRRAHAGAAASARARDGAGRRGEHQRVRGRFASRARSEAGQPVRLTREHLDCVRDDARRCEGTDREGARGRVPLRRDGEAARGLRRHARALGRGAGRPRARRRESTVRREDREVRAGVPRHDEGDVRCAARDGRLQDGGRARARAHQHVGRRADARQDQGPAAGERGERRDAARARERGVLQGEVGGAVRGRARPRTRRSTGRRATSR